MKEKYEEWKTGTFVLISFVSGGWFTTLLALVWLEINPIQIPANIIVILTCLGFTCILIGFSVMLFLKIFFTNYVIIKKGD